MKIISTICLILLSVVNISLADGIADKKAPSVADMADAVNVKDLTCVFSQNRWNYSKGERVNGKNLLSSSMHQINNINPTVECRHDDTCYFTCFDKNNRPYSGRAYATDDEGNVILIRPMQDGLPADGVIENYTSDALDLALYIEQGIMVRYDIIIEGNTVKHLRMADNPDAWRIQHFYPNGKIEAEVVINAKENKVLQRTLYNEDGSIKEY